MECQPIIRSGSAPIKMQRTQVHQVITIDIPGVLSDGKTAADVNPTHMVFDACQCKQLPEQITISESRLQDQKRIGIQLVAFKFARHFRSLVRQVGLVPSSLKDYTLIHRRTARVEIKLQTEGPGSLIGCDRPSRFPVGCEYCAPTCHGTPKTTKHPLSVR